MKHDSLTIIAPDKSDHFDVLTDMCTKIFCWTDYFKMYAYIKDYIGNSHYDWHSSRIGLINDQLVTHWGVFGYDTRVGSARLRTAGIGVVLTHPDYRKKGFLLKTALNSLDAARANGYDISILSGIPGFYHKLDYCTAWPRQNYIVGFNALPKEKPLLKPRPYRPADFKHVCSLYNRSAAHLTGTAVRPTYNWIKNPEQAFCWHNQKGDLAGYVFFEKSNASFQCQDAVGDPEQILRVAAWYARKHNAREICFTLLHHLSPLARYLRSRDCRVELHYSRNGGPMARIISLASTFRKLCPELSRRVKCSESADWHGTLRVSFPDESVCLSIADGSVSCVPLCSTPHSISGGSELVRLILGSDNPAAIADACCFRTSGDGARLMRVLFPVQFPMLSTSDAF